MARIFNLPCYAELSCDEQNYIIDILNLVKRYFIIIIIY